MLTQSFRFSEREEQSPTKLSLNCGCFLKCSPFYVKKRTGRIIQKIGRLVFVGRGMVGSFLGVFCLFLARISSWFIPMFLSILSSLFLFLSFSLSFLLVCVSHHYLSCLSRGPQAMYFKESFSFLFRPVCLSLCLIGIYVFLPKSAHK